MSNSYCIGYNDLFYKCLNRYEGVKKVSEKKKVIHVKNLEVHAENVTIIPPHHRRDPFFGPRREELENSVVDEEQEDNELEEVESESQDDQQRPPFSWI